MTPSLSLRGPALAPRKSVSGDERKLIPPGGFCVSRGICSRCRNSLLFDACAAVIFGKVKHSTVDSHVQSVGVLLNIKEQPLG